MPVALLVVLLLSTAATAAAEPDRPRLLVLTDIGGDPDDQQAMVRLMLYANEFDIEGLIASASGTPGELKERLTQPQLICQIIEAYAKVRPNLATHADGYPPAEDLLARVKSGNSNRGREAVGEGKDTEGSRWIVAAVDRPDPRPLNISIWGGQTDLAQALWRVRTDRGAEGLAKFVARLRVYDIGDQDKIVEWIWDEFPGMFYILAGPAKGQDRRTAAYRGMYLGGDESLTSREWIDSNVRRDHGPLAALYPDKTWTAPNPHGAMKEGDTPSWFYFLPNGLSDPDHPEWGCWGGRFEPAPGLGGGRSRIYRDARDAVGNVTDARATVWRWRPAFQADWRERLEWCTKPAEPHAGHPSEVALNGDRSRRVLAVDTTAGQEVTLACDADRDVAGHRAASPRWFVYAEAGTYPGEPPQLRVDSDGRIARFTAPDVTEPKTIHVILEGRDAAGPPSSSAFRRAVVTIRPKKG